MRKPFGILAVLAATMPLVVGAGGMGPGTPGAFKTTGPAFTATIVVDPHMTDRAATPGTDPVTTTAKRAAIRVVKGSLSASAVFDVGGSVLFNRGCDVRLTDVRFLYDPVLRKSLLSLVPASVITDLFNAIGEPVNFGTRVPVITDTDNAVCTVDSNNPGVLDGTGGVFYSSVMCPDGVQCANPHNQNIFVDGGDGSPALAGILSFDATIQFEVPR